MEQPNPVQTDTAMGAKMPEPRMTPQEVVGDALDSACRRHDSHSRSDS